MATTLPPDPSNRSRKRSCGVSHPIHPRTHLDRQTMTVSPFREPHEFYPTPPEATRALLSVERFDGPIWEPACGDGAIAKVLTRTRHHVVSTDLIDRGYGVGGINFLTETAPRAKHVVTNPPYGHGLADQFVLHALRLTHDTGGHVAMLLDPRRASRIHAAIVCGSPRPPANIYVLDELICQPGGQHAIHRACIPLRLVRVEARPSRPRVPLVVVHRCIS